MCGIALMLLALTQDTPLVLRVHVCIVGVYSGCPVSAAVLFLLAVLLNPGSNIFNFREVHPPSVSHHSIPD